MVHQMPEPCPPVSTRGVLQSGAPRSDEDAGQQPRKTGAAESLLSTDALSGLTAVSDGNVGARESSLVLLRALSCP